MKFVIILANLGVAVFALVLASDMRWKYASDEQIIAVILFVGMPLINCLYLFFSESIGSRNIFSMYLERKKLEEELRIADLRARSRSGSQ